jgi:hypothetical protein
MSKALALITVGLLVLALSAPSASARCWWHHHHRICSHVRYYHPYPPYYYSYGYYPYYYRRYPVYVCFPAWPICWWG